MTEPTGDPQQDPGTLAEPQLTPVRRYDLEFDRRYLADQPPPPPPPQPGDPEYRPALVPVSWHGMDLQFDEGGYGGAGDWMTGIVENVTGWYATPGLEGNNADRALTDGAVAGPKIISAREIAIEGAAVGPRARLMAFRDQLAYRASTREPKELIIGDPWLGTALSAMVRADSDSFRHAFIGGPTGFRYEVTLTAHDWRIYEQEWHQVVLTTTTAGDAGRPYDRLFHHPREADPVPDPLNGWQYEDPYPGRSAAYLRNSGNAPAPVYATYEGDLSESHLTDETDTLILASLGLGGVTIHVATETMTAEAPGGAARAEWVLPGSRPLVIPPFTTARWHLYAQGSGHVTLSWRSAWT
ncbi:MAG: hypothetical protein FWE35_22815 [Streptosporangiales bacterium]|nr:hypothetical protein [Streptosporangiales bacterium]